MISEFAFEPELVAEWLARKGPYSALLREGIGVGTPRLLSRYPKSWRDQVQQAWEARLGALEAAADSLEGQGRAQALGARAEAILQRLVLGMVSRDDLAWDASRTWLANVLPHSPAPLEHVLARQAAGLPPHVLHEGSIFDSPSWNIEPSRYVRRDSKSLADAIAPLLSRCRQVIFVDPYLGPGSPEHMRAFREFLRVTAARKAIPPPTRVEVHTVNRGATRSYLESSFRRQLEARVPAGWKVRIVWLKERSGGEELHNRYVITDLGGVTFGRGLGEGAVTEGDDLALMAHDHYRHRWHQHTSSPLAFDLDPDLKMLLLEGKPTPSRR